MDRIDANCCGCAVTEQAELWSASGRFSGVLGDNGEALYEEEIGIWRSVGSSASGWHEWVLWYYITNGAGSVECQTLDNVLKPEINEELHVDQLSNMSPALSFQSQVIYHKFYFLQHSCLVDHTARGKFDRHWESVPSAISRTRIRRLIETRKQFQYQIGFSVGKLSMNFEE